MGRKKDPLKSKQGENPVETENSSDESDVDTVDSTHSWRRKLDAIIFNDSNKISKAAGMKLLELYGELQEENDELRRKNAYLQGRVDERGVIEKKMEDVVSGKLSYADKLKKTIPKVGKKVIPPKQNNVVFLYPDSSSENGTSERTKSAIKKVLLPQTEKIQINKIKSINRGGILIEAGSPTTAVKIREAAKKAHGIRCVDNKIRRPRMQVFDVDKEVTDEDFIQRLYVQNLEDAGITEKEAREDIKICFKTGKKDTDFTNWVIEVSSKIREQLLKIGRVYLDYSSCKVVDFLLVARCYHCQGYGHMAKYCKIKDPTCSICAQTGHNYKDCKKPEGTEVCANCTKAKRDAKHMVGTMKCPIYVRAVERLVHSTSYEHK